MSRPKYHYHPVKVGTMPRECVWLTTEGPWKEGQEATFKTDLDRFTPEETCRIWQVGPPPEYMLYLER